MLATLLLGASLAALPGPAAGEAPDDLAAYEAEKARSGRGAEAHVKLALWCEARGLTAERMRHLALAVLNEPKQATARGLLGLVEFGGKWQRPDAVMDQVKADEALTAALAEYNRRRAGTPETADAQWRLAVWCEEKGLKPEAFAHFSAVTQLQPGREAAWKRLGYRRQGDRWVTSDQFAVERADAEAQKKADKTWTKQLARWRSDRSDPRRRQQAEAALAGVSDPRAVPSVWRVFAHGGEDDQRQALTLLGQIDTADSSRALAMLAVFSPAPEVRRQATETLKRRDPRDFVGWLVSLLHPELKYEVRPVGGPGSPGVLFVEGEQFNVQRTYSPPPLPDIALFPGEPITFDADGLPVVTRFLGPSQQVNRADRVLASARVSTAQFFDRAPVDPATGALIREAKQGGYVAPPGSSVSMIVQKNETTFSSTPQETTVQIPIGQILREHQRAAASSAQQLEADIEHVERQNADTRGSNDRVSQVLRGVTGHDEATDREAWAAWWTDHQGYAYNRPEPAPKPTYSEDVTPSYLPQGAPLIAQTAAVGPTTVTTSTSFSAGHSCFKAGTPVKTLLGPRPIEDVRPGDRVLTQDTATGALSYQPVLGVFHNRPAPTYAVELASDTVSATGIHRFWKAGQGWVMARDLKPGDRLRTLGGVAEVKAVQPEAAVPVFNLEVARGQSFFVGESGVLVHDNSLVAPVDAPFDGEPAHPAVAVSTR